MIVINSKTSKEPVFKSLGKDRKSSKKAVKKIAVMETDGKDREVPKE